ncbi:MAG: MFS transporter [Saprospiraceae bacterium]|nr:MFS transporter [Saprospiraceae bacterium]
MKITAKHWLAFILCAIGYIFSGTASTLLSAYLPQVISELLQRDVSQEELGDIGAYINASYLFGWMTGGLLFGIFSDRLGRKSVLGFATMLAGVFTLLTAFVPDWYVLLIFRFLSGFGVGGILLLATVYISEIWAEKSKPVILGILAIAFPVGIVTTGLITSNVTNWRSCFWLAIIPIIDAILIWLLLDESSKWRDVDKTKSVRYSAIFLPQYRINLIHGSLIFGAVLIGLWGIFSWLPTWVQTILPSGLDGNKERGISMMLLGVGGIIGGIFSGFLVKEVGNRKTLMITFLGLITMCGLLFTTNNTFTKIIYVEIVFLSLFFGLSQGALSSYIPALFPTQIRATAVGFSFNIGRLFTASAVFFVGSLVTFFGGFAPALLSFSLLFFVAFVLAYRSPEKLAIKY